MLHRPWKDLDLLLPRLATSRLPRTPGVHASQLYGKLYPPKARKVKLTEEELGLFAIGGFAVENVLEWGLCNLMADVCPECERPAEIVSPSSGVISSPDLFFYEPDADAPGGRDIRIGDIKAKWMSTKNMPLTEEGEDEFPPEFGKVFGQQKFYLYTLSEIFKHQFTHGRIIVYFVNADYKPPQPRLHGWDLDYSWQEICEEWDACMTIRRETLPEGH